MSRCREHLSAPRCRATRRRVQEGSLPNSDRPAWKSDQPQVDNDTHRIPRILLWARLTIRCMRAERDSVHCRQAGTDRAPGSRPGVTEAASAGVCPCKRPSARRERRFRGRICAGSGRNREPGRGSAGNASRKVRLDRVGGKACPSGHDRRHGRRRDSEENRSRLDLRARHPDRPASGPDGTDLRNIGINRRSRLDSRRRGRAAGHCDAAGERAARARPAQRHLDAIRTGIAERRFRPATAGSDGTAPGDDAGVPKVSIDISRDRLDVMEIVPASDQGGRGRRPGPGPRPRPSRRSPPWPIWRWPTSGKKPATP